MKKIFVVNLIVVFLTSQYGYTLASCELCGKLNVNEMGETIDRIIRPEEEQLEIMFSKLGLAGNIEQINFDDSYALKLAGIKLTYVPLYDGNIYILLEKEGNLLGAFSQNNVGMNVILPENIQPSYLSCIVCFLAFGQMASRTLVCLQFPFPDYAVFVVCVYGLTGVVLLSLCLFICQAIFS